MHIKNLIRIGAVVLAGLVSMAKAITLETNNAFLSTDIILNQAKFAGVNTSNPLYVEDGIVVSSNSTFGWNGGDAYYYYFQGSNVVVSITLQSGGTFGDVGMDIGTGFYAGSYGAYALLLNGNVVSSGSIGSLTAYYDSFNFKFVGFSGGGFDTILLSDRYGSQGYVGDGSYSAIALTNVINASSGSQITTPVPEPSTYGMMGVGALAGLGVFRRLRRKAAKAA